MIVSVNIQRISQATVTDYSEFRKPFSTVTIGDEAGSRVTLFFDPSKAQAVADAINAAIGADVPPRDVTEDVLAGVV